KLHPSCVQFRGGCLFHLCLFEVFDQTRRDDLLECRVELRIRLEELGKVSGKEEVQGCLVLGLCKDGRHVRQSCTKSSGKCGIGGFDAKEWKLNAQPERLGVLWSSVEQVLDDMLKQTGAALELAKLRKKIIETCSKLDIVGQFAH